MEKEKSLLEKAKEYDLERAHKNFTHEEMELAVAYVNGEISISQCRNALRVSSKTYANYLYRMAGAIRSGVANGNIKPLIFKKP